MKTRLFFTLLSLVFILPACSDNEPEPIVSTEPLLNKEDSLAMVEIYKDLKMDINPEFSYADRRTWPGVRFKLDEVTNEYRVITFAYGTDAIVLDKLTNKIKYKVRHLAPGAKISPAIGRLTALSKLGIGIDSRGTSDRLECPIPSEIFDCPLISLIIRGVGVDSEGYPFPEGISKLRPTIREIIFDDSKFTGGIPSDLETFINSELFDLSMINCGLSGEIPAWMGSITFYADLSYNNLTSIDWDMFNGPLVGSLPWFMYNLMGGIEVPEWVRQTDRWQLRFDIINRYQRNGELIFPRPR